MFDTPTSTLYTSLNTVLENPKEYLANVCFTFSHDIEIWAHRAIILARAPKEFIEKYVPELLKDDDDDKAIKLNMNNIMTHELFMPLLRFWYTASYSPSNKDNNEIQLDIEQLGIELGTALLPMHCDSVPDFVQLVCDLKRMRDEQIATDVTIHLISNSIPSVSTTSPDNHTNTLAIASFGAHRFLLAAQSSYFHTLFCTQFQESDSKTIHLTDDLFNASIIDVLLNFFYTDKIIVTPLNYDTTTSPIQKKLLHKKHALRVIQKAFYSADYLGHSDTLGKALLCEMETMCHQFKCVCNDCSILLPSMLAWSDKHVLVVPKLRRVLILLYSDPVLSLPTLWSQRPFALLVDSLVSCSKDVGQDTHFAVLRGDPLFRERTSKSLIHEIEERIFYNVTKHNAIHVLHSLHMCLSHIRSADPTPTWSRPILDLVHPILLYTVGMVSQFFDFYCVEYPILLSCVDGIGAGFSVDFLDFLLRHVLCEGIQIENAGIIYQGIVRDLVGRQEVVKNMAIDHVLIKARHRCAHYIQKHWSQVKSAGGFRSLDKSTLRQLADDIHIPYRNLTKLYENNDFSTLFSFTSKQRKAKKQDKHTMLNDVYNTRRLSLGNLMTRTSSQQVINRNNRPRALSTESVLLAAGQKRYTDNPPLINLLSLETEERTKRLEQGLTSYTLMTEPSTSSTRRPLLRTSSSFTSLTDQLLPVDSVLVTKTSEPDLVSRRTRLKFELPTTPSRSKSPSAPPFTSQVALSAYLSPNATKHRRGSKTSGRKSRWSIGSSNNSSDISDDDEPMFASPVVGDKIELLRRPLPTMGIIKYIGPVQFAQGPYIGVELESRLGKSDGSVDGIRYFYTDPQRGLFVKPDDFKIIK